MEGKPGVWPPHSDHDHHSAAEPESMPGPTQKPCAYLPMPQNELSHFLTPLLRKMSHAFQRSLKRETFVIK